MRRVWLLSLCLWCAPARAEVLLGLAAPLTGDQAVFGGMMKRGSEAAVSALNAAGGIRGEPVRLITYDERCDPKEAVNVASALINDGVKAVIGHFCSGASLPASDLYAEAGVLQMSPGSTAPKLTQRGLPTLFRDCGRDDAQGAVAAQRVLRDFRGKKIAVLDDRRTYGKGLADSFEGTLRASGAGADIVLRDTVNPGDKDFSVPVTKMRAAGIEVLYYGGYHPELALLLRQLDRAGMQPIVLAGDAMGTDELATNAGPAAERVLFTQGSYPEQLPALVKMRAAAQARGHTLDVYEVYSYAAVQALAAALNSSDDPTQAAAFLKQGTVPTVMGDIGFDAAGDIKDPTFDVYTFRDGKIVISR